jgi:hypothetical protein
VRDLGRLEPAVVETDRLFGGLRGDEGDPHVAREHQRRLPDRDHGVLQAGPGHAPLRRDQEHAEEAL